MTAILFAVPWLTTQVTRFTAPLAANEAPFYGVVTMRSDGYTPERRAQVASLVRRHPGEPLLAFGLGWMDRQAGDLAAAEKSYRDALRLAPANDRVMNNLANVLTLQGRTDEALDLYRRAISTNANNAAAYFNSAQIQTQRFDYHAASDALSHASALDFEMVKSQQAVTTDGHMPLVDQWIAPADFWHTLLDQPVPGADRAALPPMWRDRIEFSGMPFVLALAGTLIVGLGLGAWRQRAMPLRRCSNCDAIVCRRCAQRRRELALCRSCASVESRAQAAEFARVLLADHRRKLQRPGRLVRTAVASLIPGFGLLAFRRVVTPVFLLAISVALITAWGQAAAPFQYEPRVLSFDQEIPLAAALAPWVLVYAWSLLGYFGAQARHDARTSTASRAARARAGAPRPTPAAAA
jgi:tetratricopeptide (TPR) repeat protein